MDQRRAAAESWRVTVDRAACIGSGLCAGTAPGHFRLDDGRSHPLVEFVEPDEILLSAADSCPAEAITVYDGAGQKLAG